MNQRGADPFTPTGRMRVLLPAISAGRSAGSAGSRACARAGAGAWIEQTRLSRVRNRKGEERCCLAAPTICICWALSTSRKGNPAQGSTRGDEKEAARTPKRVAGRRRTGYPESGNWLPRSSSVGHRLTEAFAVWPWELRLPSPDGSRAVWFTSAGAASRLNRGSTSCTAHRGATAAWTRHAIGLVNPSRARSALGLRIANIRISTRARKHDVSFPRRSTFLTYPQRLPTG